MIAHTSPVEHAAIVAVSCLAIGVYAAAWFRLTRPRWGQLLAWCGGVAAVLLATSPPIEGWADESFTGHMVQHLLLIIVAPPLLVSAHPINTFRHTLPRPTETERKVARWWRRWAAIAAPVCFLTVLFGTHLTPIYDLALRHRVVHDVEHVAYLMSSVGLWAVVTAPMSSRALGRVGATFAVIAGSAIVGVVLTSASRPLIETYIDVLGPREALRDQRQAGSLMWIGGMALGLPLLMTAVWRWAAAEERVTRRTEALRDAR